MNFKYISYDTSNIKDNATYNKDFNAILLALSKIIDKGAWERFFRIEGRMNDHVSALSIDSRKLRLYCLRISDQILIVGNGGITIEKNMITDIESATFEI